MIVLTGGAGFIGSCFLRKLNDQGIKDIIVVDRLGTQMKWKNLLGKKFRKFVAKDEFRRNLLTKENADSIEAIFHFGACSSTTENDADYLMDNNLNYSIDLAEFAADHYIRFFYASSAATYGNGNKGYSDKNFEALEPLNPYGLSKSLFDQWVIDNDLDNQFTGIKFFNVFGPNEYHKGDMASMVFKSFNQIIKDNKIRLFRSYNEAFADGEQRRDFVYVKDCIEIIWKMFKKKNFSGIYNLGTGKSRSWNGLASAVVQSCSLLNPQPAVIEYIDMPDILRSQYQYFTEAEMTKLALSGIKHEFMELEESVDNYINEHLVPGKYF